jgi:transcriptional regulator with GAF, ATPase, and Fis domain
LSGNAALAPVFASAPSFGPVRGFAELDERIASGAAGVVVVRATRDVAAAVLAHLGRRLEAVGLGALVASARAGAPLFRDAALRLGVEPGDDPATCAERLATAAIERRTVILGRLPDARGWDHAVLDALASQNVLVVLTTDGDADVDGAETFTVAPELDADARACWWNAVAREADSVLGVVGLAALARWWDAARQTPADATFVPPPVGDAATALLRALALAAQPWPALRLSMLGDAGALEELVAAEAVAVERGLVVVRERWDAAAESLAGAAPADELARVAHALLDDPFQGDPWAFARAAELLLAAGAHAPADDAHARAARGLTDLGARQTLLARWVAAVDAAPDGAKLELRMRAAERAIHEGDADAAQRWAQGAASLAPSDPKVALLMGRAALGLGDLVAARVALERGLELGACSETASAAGAELAEVDYLLGQLEEARRRATETLASSQEAATCLRARNVLGKILLAESKWTEAERHFAEDELSSAMEGLTAGELRARVNRGIALLSRGQVDEARSLFEEVLAEGERVREPRACEYALSNLATVAVRQHRYFDALSLWERTLKMRQSLHDRVAAAHTVINLADLRLRLGLVDHAEQAIAFVKRVLGRGLRPTFASEFGLLSARVALARGNTLDARREVSAALGAAESVDPYYVGKAHRVAARIALEDGDVAGAADAIAKGAELATKDYARADVAILRALHARAAGEYARDLAVEAVVAARQSEDEELVREALVVAARTLLDLGERDAARAHVEQAVLVRDRVAGELQGDVRVAYLGRSGMAELDRLLRSLHEETDGAAAEPAPQTQRSSSRPAAHVPREIVGDDPAVRGLLAAIKKVGRSDSTVLVRGESGTGKELVAEALHRASDRSSGPFVAVNCAALVETLLLSELFGHEKGAFTGAVARRRGRFELAEGGTLFLDEIGDISPRTQVALLRVLQEKTFERVGGTTAIRANVRIICATHRDLKGMVERGEFREDLYYRLRGITLEVPALRARLGDVPRIAEHLLARIAIERSETPKTLAADAVELLQRHRWPGNVRELENALRAASLFAEGAQIAASDLVDNVEDLKSLADKRPSQPPPRPSFVSVSSLPVAPISQPPPGVPADSASEAGEDDGEGPLPADEACATAATYAQVRRGGVTLADMKRQIERDCIARALAETRGNITRAAALLGMKRPRLSQLVKQYGLSAVSSEDS